MKQYKVGVTLMISGKALEPRPYVPENPEWRKIESVLRFLSENPCDFSAFPMIRSTDSEFIRVEGMIRSQITPGDFFDSFFTGVRISGIEIKFERKSNRCNWFAAICMLVVHLMYNGYDSYQSFLSMCGVQLQKSVPQLELSPKRAYIIEGVPQMWQEAVGIPVDVAFPEQMSGTGAENIISVVGSVVFSNFVQFDQIPDYLRSVTEKYGEGVHGVRNEAFYRRLISQWKTVNWIFWIRVDKDPYDVQVVREKIGKAEIFFGFLYGREPDEFLESVVTQGSWGPNFFRSIYRYPCVTNLGPFSFRAADSRVAKALFHAHCDSYPFVLVDTESSSLEKNSIDDWTAIIVEDKRFKIVQGNDRSSLMELWKKSQLVLKAPWFVKGVDREYDIICEDQLRGDVMGYTIGSELRGLWEISALVKSTWVKDPVGKHLSINGAFAAFYGLLLSFMGQAPDVTFHSWDEVRKKQLFETFLPLCCHRRNSFPHTERRKLEIATVVYVSHQRGKSCRLESTQLCRSSPKSTMSRVNNWHKDLVITFRGRMPFVYPKIIVTDEDLSLVLPYLKYSMEESVGKDVVAQSHYLKCLFGSSWPQIDVIAYKLMQVKSVECELDFNYVIRTLVSLHECEYQYGFVRDSIRVPRFCLSMWGAEMMPHRTCKAKIRDVTPYVRLNCWDVDEEYWVTD